MDTNNVEMVHYLVAEHEPPIFPDYIDTDSDACLLELVRAACPMSADEHGQLRLLVEPWYTFMSLHRRAAKQKLLPQPFLVHRRLPQAKELAFWDGMNSIKQSRQHTITRHLRSSMLPARGCWLSWQGFLRSWHGTARPCGSAAASARALLTMSLG